MISPNDLPEGGWRSSSYSGSNGGTCVEVVDGLPVVPVRDSKAKDGLALSFGPVAWSVFVDSVK
ncbi:DUF397 domain-containing protein [Streptomyces sp. NPDC007084]|uniref:DUF397 domain-containing protein n=1 Tax=Streptomyces sp. NPDC007084 TaxID=3154313 RepID=UPI003456E276